jgi:hypothetical protein
VRRAMSSPVSSLAQWILAEALVCGLAGDAELAGDLGPGVSSGSGAGDGGVEGAVGLAGGGVGFGDPAEDVERRAGGLGPGVVPLPRVERRPRRFLTWFGLITTTVIPASRRTPATGPSGRSIAASRTPARARTSISSRGPAALCPAECRRISRPWHRRPTRRDHHAPSRSRTSRH